MTPTLATPNFTKPFLIKYDASRFGIGAILIQEGHLIALHIILGKI